jgi:hypothetical protein
MPTSNYNTISADPIAEIAEILAGGLQRLLAQKSSPISSEIGDFCLDISARESGPNLHEGGELR